MCKLRIYQTKNVNGVCKFSFVTCNLILICGVCKFTYINLQRMSTDALPFTMFHFHNTYLTFSSFLFIVLLYIYIYIDIYSFRVASHRISSHLQWLCDRVANGMTCMIRFLNSFDFRICQLQLQARNRFLHLLLKSPLDRSRQ